MIDAALRASREIAQDRGPDRLGLPGDHHVHVLERLLDPVRDMRPASDDAHAEGAVAIGERVGAAREAGEERERDHVRRGVDGDRAHLLVEELDLVLRRGDRREVNPGDRRDEVKAVAPAIAGDVTHDNPHLHEHLLGIMRLIGSDPR